MIFNGKQFPYLMLSAVLFFNCLVISQAHPITIEKTNPIAAQSMLSLFAGEEITLQIPESFFNRILETIFSHLSPPTFPLSLNQHAARGGKNIAGPAECQSQISLTREMDGTRTAVKFREGKITAALAFYGSYRVGLIGSCVSFSGWADTNINLVFEPQRQTLTARVTVENIRLRGVPSLASGVVVGLVQDALDEKINPVEILKAAQLSTVFPVTGTNGGLKLTARKITPEITDGVLRLHIEYEFAGQMR